MAVNKSARANDAVDRREDARQWLHEHGDALYRYARLRLARRELAEDLVQETFIAAIQAQRLFRGEADARTWLISILRRKIVDYYRKRTVSRGAEAEAASATPEHVRVFTSDGKWRKVPTPWHTPRDLLESAEFWHVFQRCLARLPAPLASAFVLREVEDMPIRELSDSFAQSAGTIRVRLHRARLLLRECLEQNWFGEQVRKRTGAS